MYSQSRAYDRACRGCAGLDTLQPPQRLFDLLKRRQHLRPPSPDTIHDLDAARLHHRVDEMLTEDVLLQLQVQSGQPDEELLGSTAPPRPLLEMAPQAADRTVSIAAPPAA